MSVNYYKVGNLNDFEALNVPQLEQELELEDLGVAKVVFIKGFSFSVIFNGEMLTPNLNGRNPFYKQHTTAYVDPQTRDIWVGYEVNM